MPNQQHPPGIAILRDVAGRLALFINGQRSDRRGQGQLSLLACLLDNLGRAVPYKRLVTVIGRKSDNVQVFGRRDDGLTTRRGGRP